MVTKITDKTNVPIGIKVVAFDAVGTALVGYLEPTTYRPPYSKDHYSIWTCVGQECQKLMFVTHFIRVETLLKERPTPNYKPVKIYLGPHGSGKTTRAISEVKDREHRIIYMVKSAKMDIFPIIDLEVAVLDGVGHVHQIIDLLLLEDRPELIITSNVLSHDDFPKLPFIEIIDLKHGN